jgi:AcrR family transcriptional regulator
VKRRLVQERATRRRDEALRVTLDMLRTDGPAGVTLRAVAGRSGVPLGTLTYYFAGREELLREALRLWVDEELARVATLADVIRDEGLGPREAAARCAEVLQSYDPEQVAQYELYLLAARMPELREAVEEAFLGYDRIVAAILDAAGASDAERLAPLFVSLVDGHSLRRLAAPRLAPPLADSLADLFEGVGRARG